MPFFGVPLTDHPGSQNHGTRRRSGASILPRVFIRSIRARNIAPGLSWSILRLSRPADTSKDWLSQAKPVETILPDRCRRISHTLRQGIANPENSNSKTQPTDSAGRSGPTSTSSAACGRKFAKFCGSAGSQLKFWRSRAS